jgi:hypothetical protein
MTGAGFCWRKALGPKRSQRWRKLFHSPIEAGDIFPPLDTLMERQVGRIWPILAELSVTSKQRYVASFDFALVNAGLAERDQAIYWLERACTERESHLPFLQVDPRLASLRMDPRFEALLKRVGLKPGAV